MGETNLWEEQVGGRNKLVGGTSWWEEQVGGRGKLVGGASWWEGHPAPITTLPINQCTHNLLYTVEE